MLDVNHPLRQSNWIWPENYLYLLNHFAQFRKDFELPEVPVSVTMFITADKEYRLYINGTYVCRGPARGYQSHWPYDEVEISSYLRVGHNWIAVEAYNPGISTFSYLHQTKAGFLCAVDIGDVKIRSKSDQWLMRRSPAQTPDVGRLSLQMDFQEHIDMAKDDRSWITSENAPTDWVAYPVCKAFFPSANFGTPPYDDVEERGIPLLREEWVAPEKVVSTASGKCAEGYESCKNVTWFYMDNELQPKAEWNLNPSMQYTVEGDTMTLYFEPTGLGNFTCATVELDKIYLATVRLEVLGATGKEIIDLHAQQFLLDGYPIYMEPGCGCMVAQSNRLRPAKGNCQHEFFHLLGQKHIVLQVRDAEQPLIIRISMHTAGYPFTMRGAFSCSDETLNAIYGICRHTQQLCSLDAYMDTPWREQAQWWGDARIQARNTFYLDGDARLLKRGIRSLAGQRAPEGLTYGHAPTSSGWCILPDFALAWIMTVYDYYFQTGDLELFHEQHGRIGEILSYFDGPEVRLANGLIRHDHRFWLFEDWSELEKDDIPCTLNLWYILALTYYHKLLKAAGEGQKACDIFRKIQEHKECVNKYFFNEKTGLFEECLKLDGTVVGEPSVHAQVLALILGMKPEAQESMLTQRILPYLRCESVPGAAPSAMWTTYLFTAIRTLRLPYLQEVIDFIRTKWSPMLKTGTTWEHFQYVFDWSVCHAWSAHPASEFVNVLVGIEQIEVNWKKVRFAPFFAQGINQAEALIPTPRGDVRGNWERCGNRISGDLVLPDTVEAVVVLPGREPENICSGYSYHFEIEL